MSNLWSSKRRGFLKMLPALAAAGSLRPNSLAAAYLAERRGEAYRRLGVRPLINAAGTYTTLTGSVMAPETVQAMASAAEVFVPLVDLQKAVGARVAKLIGVEAAMVSSGGAGSIMLATAACMAGKDPEKIRRIPDTTGVKNEVIMVREHRMGFDHASRACGAKIVEVGTVDELRKAIGPKTAMLFFVHIYEPKGKISRAEFIKAGKAAGVPVFNDAAAELPPAMNLSEIVKEGFDLVGFSGGKGLRGPQASGLLVGRADLIEAAAMNNNPYSDTVGRHAKVGKEEIMALLKAVEIYVARDHDEDQRLWHGYMSRVSKEVRDIPTVKSEIYVPGPGGHPVPYLRVQWDEGRLGLSYADCAKRLSEGEPRIEVNAAKDEITLASYNLFPGEDRIVAWRLREILTDAAAESSRRSKA
ncbi:MAG: aminotransferase class V-fold PLP-dependent enzyme [Bryobacterales bacterium]|nr:aminotransferase class V-fold PLP-dependent enzyme [Bryobacterales bacterium]